MDFSAIREISVYVGGKCNFDCSYCDRSSVAEAGYQRLTSADVDKVCDYICAHPYPLEMISFHGGEPFLNTRVMDLILDQLVARGFNLPTVFIQTNGSMLLKQSAFLEKWKEVLFVSISYDFYFQELNRDYIDINQTLTLLNKLNIGVQLQHVIPSQEKDVFSSEHVESIIRLHTNYRIDSIDLILLRHIRGSEGRFRVILNEVNLVRVFQGLIGLLGVLYAHGVRAVVDGSAGVDINKNYFTTPPFVILSPDGYIYTEYDFLEYKVKGSQVGYWRDQRIIPVMSLSHGDDRMVYPECMNCPSFHLCGIKFLHRDTNTPVKNPDRCRDFYQQLNIAHKYNLALQSKPSLLHHFMDKL